MKKICFTIVITVFAFHFSPAQYYYQYFDGADTAAINSVLIDLNPSSTNIWQIGSPQKQIFNSASTQPNAMVTLTNGYYPPGDTSRFIAKVWLNFWSWGVFALQWTQKLDMDHDADGGIIEYSIDSGNTWNNVFNDPYVYNFYGFDTANADTLTGNTYAFSGTDTSWKDIWLCFDYSWLWQFTYDTVLFRFSFVSDTIDNFKEGWLIDNMLAHITMIHTVKEDMNEPYLSVFPNPAKNRVTVQAAKMSEYHIIEHMELTDAMGRTVEKWDNIPVKFWFDTGRYRKGLYYLHVKTNFRTETVPLTITKD